MEAGDSLAIARIRRDVWIVSAGGELDGSNSPELEEALHAARMRGARRLIADLATVTYIDSDALAVLARCARELRGTGRRLIVVADDPWLVRMLRIVSLDGAIQVERSLREVVADVTPTVVGL